jgi:hypothetical protein
MESLEQRRLLSVSSTFSTPVSYNIGNSPSAPAGNVSADGVATGDLNGDGRADLAIVHSVDGTVNVLLNKGGGTFSSAVKYPTGNQNPVWVTIADVNGDGRRDLLVLGSHGTSAGSIAVLLGNGNGTFKTAVNYAAGGVARGGIAVADFNGDHRPDLAVAQFAAINSTQSAVDILINNGGGTFKPFYTVGVWPAARSVTTGDFNRDGKADLAVADGLGVNNTLDSKYPAGVTILLGKGNGSFTTAAQYKAPPTPDKGEDGHGGGDIVNPELITAADLNNDGKLDLIESLYDHNIDVFLGNGNGTFHSAVGYNTGEYPRAVAVADVNGDGRKDLIVNNIGKRVSSTDIEPGSIAVLLGRGDGTFITPAIQYTPFDFPGWLASADFNADGHPDLAVTRVGDGHSVNIFLGHTPRTVSLPTVTHVTPTAGPTSGGTLVTITGTNFTDVMSVKFGKVNAAFTVKSATTIVATAPPESAGVVDVIVSNAAGASHAVAADHFTFKKSTTLPAPVVIGPGTTTKPGPVLTTLRPTFTWHPVTIPGITAYQLNLFNITTQHFTSYVISGASSSSFTLPTTAALLPGDSYVWNLRVLVGTQSGPPSAYLYFQTHA